MKNQYRYDAFISYRHCELDKFVAENLHRQMEAFKLPSNVAKNDSLTRSKIERVFRDREELPIAANLEDPIVEALKTSEFLVVICTPRLKDSMWCRKEIETFIEMHGREKVLAVLAEGEPGDSFPPELLYRDKVVTDPDGSTHVEREAIEPLGADVRGVDNKAVLKAIKAELPRLLAPIFGTSYDGLRQRHREQRMRKIIAASAVAAAVGITFGTVSTVMALQIQKQKSQIEVQNEEIIAKNDEIMAQNVAIKNQAEEIAAQNDILLNNQAVNLAEESLRQLSSGDRVGAIETAVDALTAHNGIKMPYTDRAVFALTESMHTYDRGNVLRPVYQVKLKGTVDWMTNLERGKYVLVKDSAQMMYLIYISDGKVVKTFDNIYDSQEVSAAFVSETKFVYVDNRSQVHIYDIETDTETDISLSIKPSWVKVGSDGDTLIAQNSTELCIYSLSKSSAYAVITEEDRYIRNSGEFSEVNGQKYYVFYDYIFKDETAGRLHRFNITTGEDLVLPFGDRTIADMIYTGENVAILTSRFYNGYFDYDAYLTMYRLADMKVMWETEFSNTAGTSLVEGLGDKKELLAFCGWTAEGVNALTGEKVATYSLGSSVVAAYPVADSNYYVLFTREGKRHVVNADAKTSTEYADAFDSHSNNVKAHAFVAGGYMVGAYTENAVTMYGYLGFENTSEKEVSIPEKELYRYAQASEIAQEKGYETPALASNLFYSDDKSLVFVGYRDDSFRIYDGATGALLGEADEGGNYINTYLGTDAEGSYLVGYRGFALKISKDHQVVAKLRNFRGFDAQSNTFYFESNGDKFECPNYSLNELLDKANEIVLKYTDK